MTKDFVRKLRRLNIATHRDFGYFFSALIIIYCVSGLALNHIDEWNPDFIIERKDIKLITQLSNPLTTENIENLGKEVGEASYKVYDIPAPGKAKIYYDNATLLVDLVDGTGQYEKISRRPVFYQANVLHRNSLRGWKWVSDIFGVMLILISVTGLFILKGEKGVVGRGKWFMAAGLLVPVIALIMHEFFQK
jgi:hypothetical protein